LKKIITVIGARPQFIKAAVVSRAVKKQGLLQEVIVHTGQHFDHNMSDVFFREMEIPAPQYNLGINTMNHGAMTGRMMESLEAVMNKEKPHMVLVYGDTNSTLAGALTAVKLNIPVAHVEAGLRSFNNSMPEEINRILTDRISSLLFCPTSNAEKNLENEGFRNFDCEIHRPGDVMYDAALYYSVFSSENSGILKKLRLNEPPFILCTIHRQENTSDIQKLRSIVNALNDLSKKWKVILPLHPGTRKLLKENKIEPDFNNIEPVGYFDMLELLKKCAVVITDSGGLQKEAYFFNKFCVTIREETEWTELVAAGANLLAGSDPERIVQACTENIGRKLETKGDFFGKGNAGELIAENILKNLSINPKIS